MRGRVSIFGFLLRLFLGFRRFFCVLGIVGMKEKGRKKGEGRVGRVPGRNVGSAGWMFGVAEVGWKLIKVGEGNWLWAEKGIWAWIVWA